MSWHKNVPDPSAEMLFYKSTKFINQILLPHENWGVKTIIIIIINNSNRSSSIYEMARVHLSGAPWI